MDGATAHASPGPPAAAQEGAQPSTYTGPLGPPDSHYNLELSPLGPINDVLSDSGGSLESGQGDGPTGSQKRDYTLHLSQLFLQGRSIHSVQGKEAEELGTQLHSVGPYIVASRKRAHL